MSTRFSIRVGFVAVLAAAALIGNNGGVSAASTVPAPTLSSECTTGQVAPPGFHPMGASVAQLQAYGYPQRPTGGPGLATWTTAMKTLRHLLPPTNCRSASAATLAPDTAIGQDRTSWAGFDATTNTNGQEQFDAVLGQWKVPTVPANGAYPEYLVTNPMDSFWVGLGGAASFASIAQAGIVTVSQAEPLYSFFEETTSYQSRPVLESQPTVGPGQTVYVQVSYSGSTAYYFLENETTGTAKTYTTSEPQVDRQSAECVGEWPQFTQSANLPNFGSAPFSSCAAEVNNSGYFSNMSSYNYTQDGDWCFNRKTGDPVLRVQYPSALSGGSFVVHWQQSGPCTDWNYT